jgi:hypothetical protein
LNNFSSSSQQANKRGKLENTIPVAIPPAAKISDKERSDKDEREIRELTPSSPLDTRSESSPSSPKPFFTDDGMHELLAIALLRSRRQEKLKKWRRPIVMENGTARPPEAKDQSPSLINSSVSGKDLSHSPPPEEIAGPEASQDSYGGDWVVHFADEFLAEGSSAVMTSPRNATAADRGSSSKGNPATTRHQ